MRLGLSSYTYGWAVGVPGHPPVRPLDEHGLLDRAGEQGIKLLQIGDNLPLETFEDARLARLAARAIGEGVQLEIGARRLTRERVVQFAALARRLQARLIRFVIDDANYQPAPDAVARILRDCVPELEGLILGIENHDRFSAATLRGLIESAASERVGVCLDTANSLGAGEGLEAVVTSLAPSTVNLHLKDFRIDRLSHKMGFTVSGCPAGTGFLDVPELLKQLLPFSRCQTAILEVWTPPENDLEQTIGKEAHWAALSLRYLKPFFPERPD